MNDEVERRGHNGTRDGIVANNREKDIYLNSDESFAQNTGRSLLTPTTQNIEEAWRLKDRCDKSSEFPLFLLTNLFSLSSYEWWYTITCNLSTIYPKRILR